VQRLLSHLEYREKKLGRKQYSPSLSGLKNGFFKSPTQWVFWVLLGYWVLLGFFLDKQEKIGKIIQKLSNFKP